MTKAHNYYDKLKALLEGLEIEHIEHLLENGDVETYKILGEMIAQKCKWGKNDQLAIFNYTAIIVYSNCSIYILNYYNQSNRKIKIQK